MLNNSWLKRTHLSQLICRGIASHLFIARPISRTSHTRLKKLIFDYRCQPDDRFLAYNSTMVRKMWHVPFESQLLLWNVDCCSIQSQMASGALTWYSPQPDHTQQGSSTARLEGIWYMDQISAMVSGELQGCDHRTHRAVDQFHSLSMNMSLLWACQKSSCCIIAQRVNYHPIHTWDLPKRPENTSQFEACGDY